MLETEVGALPVEVPGVGAIVGIITDRDYRRVGPWAGTFHLHHHRRIHDRVTGSLSRNGRGNEVAARMREIAVRRLVVMWTMTGASSASSASSIFRPKRQRRDLQ